MPQTQYNQDWPGALRKWDLRALESLHSSKTPLPDPDVVLDAWSQGYASATLCAVMHLLSPTSVNPELVAQGVVRAEVDAVTKVASRWLGILVNQLPEASITPSAAAAAMDRHWPHARQIIDSVMTAPHLVGMHHVPLSDLMADEEVGVPPTLPIDLAVCLGDRAAHECRPRRLGAGR